MRRIPFRLESPPGCLNVPVPACCAHKGAGLGLLGQRDVTDTPFNITLYTAEGIAAQNAATLCRCWKTILRCATLVACAIGLSTVVFQTVSHNTILTPSVMGLDALYLFVQAALVLVLGAAGVSGLGEIGRYALNVAFMVGFSVLLLERFFRFNTVLSIVVEFLGGIVFIVLLMRKGKP